jgi:hypothetical protein
MQPTPVYTTIATVQNVEGDALLTYTYSLVLKHVAAWTDTFTDDDGAEQREEYNADNHIRMYRHCEDLAPDADEFIEVPLDYCDGAPTVQDVEDSDWNILFSDAYWSDSAFGHGCYVERQRLIVRLLQEAGVP